MAQLIAHHVAMNNGVFNGTFYGNKNIYFSDLLDSNFIWKEDRKLQIAHFMQEVALNTQTKFDCSGSGTWLDMAINYLKDLGFTGYLDKHELNKNELIKTLKAGFPVIVAGSGKVGGHAWLITQYFTQNGQDGYYVNWGWGMYDSEYTGHYFTYNKEDGRDFADNHSAIYIFSGPKAY